MVAVFLDFLEVLEEIFEQNTDLDEFDNILEHEGENCFTPSGNCCVLKCNNFIFKHVFTKEYLEFIQTYKRRTNVMTRCRIPEFCERYKIDTGIYEIKCKRILPRSGIERNICLHIHKNH